MLNRRTFLAGCCALHSFPKSVSAQTTGSSFICATVDRQDKLTIEEQADSVEQLDIEQSIREFDISPYATINVADRWLRSDGLHPKSGRITLGVFFMGGDSSAHSRVVADAKVWEDKLKGAISFDFSVPIEKSLVRVDFESNDGDWSVIGRHAARVRKDRKTMNLVNLLSDCIQHEFGHCCGLQHEHSHPGGTFRWKEDVVIAAMAKFKWSKAMVESNIFARYNRSYACLNNPKPDYQSVMFYPIPYGWAEIQKTPGGPWETLTHPGGNLISAEDVRCLKGVYGLKA